MSRMPLIALSLLACCLVPGAAEAADPEISFSVRGEEDDHVRLRIRSDDWDGNGWNGRDGNHSWNQRLALADLNGISRAAVDRGGPVSFAYVRPAGRFDCSGEARNRTAQGRCTFTANEAFSRFLADRGIETPTASQRHGLAISGVDSDLIDAVIRAGLGTPTPEQLIGLGIFKVTPDYVRAMAQINGFKPRIGDLVQFKIFKITPESVQAFARIGFPDLSAHDLVQFSIFKVTPDFVREMADAGYRGVSPETLVRMRMFGVTPDFARNMAARAEGKPSAQALVRMRLTGMRPQDGWRRDWQRNWRWNARRDD